jgi:hypothetical protein
MVDAAAGQCTGIQIGVGDALKPYARAEGGHEQQCNANNEADIKHGDSSLSSGNAPKPYEVDAATGWGATLN